LALALLAGCGGPAAFHHRHYRTPAQAVSVRRLAAAAEAWHSPPYADAFAGVRLVADAPRPAVPAAAVTRQIVRANPRLGVADALMLATHAETVADGVGLDYGFFSATLLEESAFAPDALSSAGAVGIAQFTLETADGYGIDPFDWRDAMAGAARLLRRYLDDYAGRYTDPYAAALAAYNAGPGAVAQYGGIPPYPETEAYIADIYDRWARIELDVRMDGPRRAR
jgi:soluble lytic murein transglycosylase-like protein